MNTNVLIASWSRLSASTHLKAEIGHAFQFGPVKPPRWDEARPCRGAAPSRALLTRRRLLHGADAESRKGRSKPLALLRSSKSLKRSLDDELECVRGDEWRMLCPVHAERTPSCFVNAEKNV